MVVCSIVTTFAAAESLEATAKAARAGDLITIEHGATSEDIRLYGIDAPDKGQPGHEEARDFVGALVKDKAVTIELKAKDNSGHKVGIVRTEDYQNVNAEVLKQGHAWWDQPNAPEEKKYKGYAAKAIIAETGLWGEGAPLAPWDYRKGKLLEPVTYKVEEEAAPAEEAMEETPQSKTLEIKGDGPPSKVRGGNAIYFDPNAVRLDQKIEPMALVGKHNPDFVTDSNGNVLGMTAQNVAQIPYASQLGFQEGDIVSSVNGVRLQSFDQILSMAPRFKDTKRFEVELIRNGQPMTLDINVP